MEQEEARCGPLRPDGVTPTGVEAEPTWFFTPASTEIGLLCVELPAAGGGATRRMSQWLLTAPGRHRVQVRLVGGGPERGIWIGLTGRGADRDRARRARDALVQRVLDQFEAWGSPAPMGSGPPPLGPPLQLSIHGRATGGAALVETRSLLGDLWAVGRRATLALDLVRTGAHPALQLEAHRFWERVSERPPRRGSERLFDDGHDLDWLDRRPAEELRALAKTERLLPQLAGLRVRGTLHGLPAASALVRQLLQRAALRDALGAAAGSGRWVSAGLGLAHDVARFMLVQPIELSEE